jgi:hypothetical protein
MNTKLTFAAMINSMERVSIDKTMQRICTNILLNRR